jgi:aspartate/methionine/tyrosine aminotransferase
MVAPSHLFTAIKKIQDTVLICPPVISQYAALGALEAGKDYCRTHLGALAEVRDLVLGELDRIRNICIVPEAEGAFYFLIRVDTELSSMEITERLVREHGVAVIPGTAFGMEAGCYLRVAYGALERSTVAEGMGRLVKGIRSILHA